jgi:hypothetical protein
MADITLAVVPIAATLLKESLDLYDLFTKAKQIGGASQMLLWKFRIQQKRLQIWGDEWGLLASSSHPSTVERNKEDDHLVLETLTRIMSMLKDYKILKNRYGLSLVSDEPSYRALVG